MIHLILTNMVLISLKLLKYVLILMIMSFKLVSYTDFGFVSN
jgi:hypothetical protein